MLLTFLYGRSRQEGDLNWEADGEALGRLPAVFPLVRGSWLCLVLASTHRQQAGTAGPLCPSPGVFIPWRHEKART